MVNDDHRCRRTLYAMLAGRAQEHARERAEPTTADDEQAGPLGSVDEDLCRVTFGHPQHQRDGWFGAKDLVGDLLQLLTRLALEVDVGVVGRISIRRRRPPGGDGKQFGRGDTSLLSRPSQGILARLRAVDSDDDDRPLLSSRSPALSRCICQELSILQS
jgi:hypothetical protein